MTSDASVARILLAFNQHVAGSEACEGRLEVAR
jgi:hypothetical protein